MRPDGKMLAIFHASATFGRKKGGKRGKKGQPDGTMLAAALHYFPFREKKEKGKGKPFGKEIATVARAPFL